MLVCPAVFKTVAGGEELPRWVRFPHTLANGNRSGSAAPVFVHFNPSVNPPCGVLPAPRPGSLLVQYKLKTKSLPVEGGGFCEAKDGGSLPALKGEVDASVTSRRRGCIEVALVYANPSVNPPCGVLPAPRPGSLLGTVPPNARARYPANYRLYAYTNFNIMFFNSNADLY